MAISDLIWDDFMKKGTLHQAMSSDEALQWFLDRDPILRLLDTYKVSKEDVGTW